MLWNDARYNCINKNVGGRKGWRLPSISELASLVDPTQTNPALPLGHPFTFPNITVNYAYVWSATTWSHNPPFGVTIPPSVWIVIFDIGGVATFGKESGALFQAWCVRGGTNAEPY